MPDVGVSVSGQIDKRCDTGVVSIENRRFQQTRTSVPNVVEQFVKYCRSGLVCGEPRVGVMDRAVDLLLVISNGTFRPRHELLLLFPELDLLRRQHSSAPPMSVRNGRTPTSQSRPIRSSA